MIRQACFLDIPSILNLGNRYVEEEVKKVGYHSAEWNADVSARSLAVTLSSSGEFLYVAVVDGEVVGFLWAACHFMAPWNLVYVASDYLFYIVPEKRGTMLGLRLVKAYKQWAEDLGCQEVRLSLASGINEERVGKMYSLLGFTQLGTVFNYKAKGD